MKSKKRKILYISGTRADYGLMKTTLLAIQKSRKLNLEIVVTGMHLMPEFGSTIKEIKKDRFKIRIADAIYEKDNPESMARFIGEFALLLTGEVKKIKPDIILLMGDRPEMLAGAIVGSYLGIKVVHIHGGEKSGTVDDKARDAITKLADLHLTATEKSAERIIKMGIDARQVKIVGAPGLEKNLKNIIPKNKIIKKYEIERKKPILLVAQHPVSEEVKKAAWQMRQTMETIKELKYPAIIVYPNSDAGGREMIKVIEEYRDYPFIKIFKSIPREDFLGLMETAGVMLGNSSSGIIEAASFNLSVVNIGQRQKGRERGSNVIDVDYDKNQIKKAVLETIKIHPVKCRELAIPPSAELFNRVKNKKYANPYFIKNTEEKIIKILES